MKHFILTIFFALLLCTPIYAQQIESIALSPEEVIVNVGETVRFSAQVYDAQNNIVKAKVKWSVEGNIGTIKSNGQFSPTQPGIGYVVATVGEITERATITVSTAVGKGVFPEIDHIEISPSSATLSEGDNLNFQIKVYDTDGNQIATGWIWQMLADFATYWSVEGNIGNNKTKRLI